MEDSDDAVSYSPDNSPSYMPSSPISLSDEEKYSQTDEFRLEESGYLQKCRCTPTCTDLGTCRTFRLGSHQHVEINGVQDSDKMLNDGWATSDEEEKEESIKDELLDDISVDTQDEKLEQGRQAFHDDTSSVALLNPFFAEPAVDVEDTVASNDIPADSKDGETQQSVCQA